MSKLLFIMKRRQERLIKKKKSKGKTLAAEHLSTKILEINQIATQKDENDSSEFLTSIRLYSADEKKRAYDV